MTNATITKDAGVAAMAAIVSAAPAVAAVAADKAAAAKPRTRRAPQAAKTTAATTAPAASVVTKAAKKLAIKYTITAARPAAGRQLAAFTHAVLEMLDMYKGKKYDRKTLTDIIGSRAVAYHLTTTCALEMDDNGIGLSGDYGKDFFMQRATNKAFDPQDVADYKTILTTGKADNRLVKNQNFIKAI
jgi:hypothetical protein